MQAKRLRLKRELTLFYNLPEKAWRIGVHDRTIYFVTTGGELWASFPVSGEDNYGRPSSGHGTPRLVEIANMPARDHHAWADNLIRSMESVAAPTNRRGGPLTRTGVTDRVAAGQVIRPF